MSEETKVPAWLETMANKIAVDENWPSGQYPQAAFDALDIVGETAVDGDSAVSLLQVVIDEVERIKSIDKRLAGILRYAEKHCGHSPLAGKPGEGTLMEDHHRLRVIADATEEFLSDGPGEIFQAIRDLRSAVEAAGKEAAEEHAEIERLRAIADVVGELPLGDGVSACVPQSVINAIFAVWTAWKEPPKPQGRRQEHEPTAQ